MTLLEQLIEIKSLQLALMEREGYSEDVYQAYKSLIEAIEDLEDEIND